MLYLRTHGKREPRMWVHEGGHLLLGVGDEYEEKGKPDEFVVRRLLSNGQAEETRFASFHERTFRLCSRLPRQRAEGMGQNGCHASLVEERRPLARSFAITVGGGRASFARGKGIFVDIGLDVGWTDTRERAVEKIAGIHLKLLAEEGEEASYAFLLGARFGLQRRFGGSGHALVLGGFAEAGGGLFEIGSEQGSKLGPYGEVGGYLDFRPSLKKDAPGIRLEGALGGRMNTTGQIGDMPPGSPSTSLPMEYWARLGLSVVFPF